MKTARTAAKKHSPTQWAYEAITGLIFSRALPAGEKINQTDLAKRLKLSRTPVEKALHKLETHGLVRNIPQKGFYVHGLTVKELLNLFSLREALEAMVVEDIVDTITDEQLDRLAKLTEPFEKAKDGEYWKADVRFHFFLLDICGNAFARKIEDSFHVLQRTLRIGPIRKTPHTISEHKALVAALRARDIAKARAAVTAHCARSKQVLQEMADNLRRLGLDPGRLPVEQYLDRLTGPRKA
ncbi:MAG: GntR family transcriptional regulator [Kiritimatiellae bacterium]|nr:GntR family transcriptional regulator [Kiritimatiellia bacterium]